MAFPIVQATLHSNQMRETILQIWENPRLLMAKRTELQTSHIPASRPTLHRATMIILFHRSRERRPILTPLTATMVLTRTVCHTPLATKVSPMTCRRRHLLHRRPASHSQRNHRLIIRTYPRKVTHSRLLCMAQNKTMDVATGSRGLVMGGQPHQAGLPATTSAPCPYWQSQNRLHILPIPLKMAHGPIPPPRRRLAQSATLDLIQPIFRSRHSTLLSIRPRLRCRGTILIHRLRHHRTRIPLRSTTLPPVICKVHQWQGGTGLDTTTGVMYHLPPIVSRTPIHLAPVVTRICISLLGIPVNHEASPPSNLSRILPILNPYSLPRAQHLKSDIGRGRNPMDNEGHFGKDRYGLAKRIFCAIILVV